MRTKLRHWWRGYSDVDVASAIFKLSIAHLWARPGGLMPMTTGEMRVMTQ